jgi:D-xylose transport system substrate-binding protein
MRKGIRAVAVLAATGLAVTGLAACSKTNTPTSTTKTPFIGVILPDSGQSSVRWETNDHPALEAAFKKAGIKYDIQNANGDKTKFQTIGDSMISEGVTVLMIVDLDSGSGSAVLKKAHDAGIGTIDYDRLTLGGGADYYVSFDNVAVGTLQGQGLISCLTAAGKTKAKIIELNGSPTDNNATLFKQGYDAALKPKYDSGDYTKVGDQSVPDWDNTKAQSVFQGMFTTAGGQVDGVLAANDGLGNAAINVLSANGLTVPVTGQDATVQGLQNILAGKQCMTVFKDQTLEANGAADLAVALANGQTPTGLGQITDTQTNQPVKFKQLTPQAITKDTVKQLVTSNYVKYSDLCTAAFVAACTAAGITAS